MPSGAKKRKAAKRRKEQEQQQQLGGGAHSPESPTSVATDSSRPPQGNGLKEEDDHDSNGSESGSDVTSPTAQPQDHRHNLEISGAHEQSDAGGEDSVKESGSSRSVDVEVTGSAVNGGDGNASEPLAHQKMEETAELTGEEAVAAAVVGKEEVAPLPPSNAVPRTPVEAPISEPGAVGSEHVPPEKGEDVSVLGDLPSAVEIKQREASGAGDLVEQPVHTPIAEEVVQPTDVPVESLEGVDNTTVASSNGNEQKSVPPTDATEREQDPTVESNPGCGSHRTTRSSEVVRPVHLQQRASWLSCCGLFDVIANASN